MEQLTEIRKRQMEVANVLVETMSKMSQHVEQVRATLPPDVDEEALMAALAKNAEWQALAAKAQEQRDLDKKILEEANTVIRARALEEAQAIKDVEAGKVRALDVPRAKNVEKKKEAQAIKDVEADKVRALDASRAKHVEKKKE